MDDSNVLANIEQLVTEEKALLASQGRDPNPEQHERLQQVQVELDRCWDLLRQRRAQEEFGQDPDQVQVRDADTVEGYEQ